MPRRINQHLNHLLIQLTGSPSSVTKSNRGPMSPAPSSNASPGQHHHLRQQPPSRRTRELLLACSNNPLCLPGPPQRTNACRQRLGAASHALKLHLKGRLIIMPRLPAALCSTRPPTGRSSDRPDLAQQSTYNPRRAFAQFTSTRESTNRHSAEWRMPLLVD